MQNITQETLSYLPDWDFNGIGNVSIGQACEIKIAIADALLVTGTQIVPEENPLTLFEGWNLIANFRTELASADLVLADLVEQGMVVIAKDYSGKTFYQNGVLMVLEILKLVKDIK